MGMDRTRCEMGVSWCWSMDVTGPVERDEGQRGGGRGRLRLPASVPRGVWEGGENDAHNCCVWVREAGRRLRRALDGPRRFDARGCTSASARSKHEMERKRALRRAWVRAEEKEKI